VDITDVKELPQWKLKVGTAIPHTSKGPAVLLSDMVELDEKGAFVSSCAALRQALGHYMEMTFVMSDSHRDILWISSNVSIIALVPPPKGDRSRRACKPDWDAIALAEDTSLYVDDAYPPPPNVTFDNPSG